MNFLKQKIFVQNCKVLHPNFELNTVSSQKNFRYSFFSGFKIMKLWQKFMVFVSFHKLFDSCSAKFKRRRFLTKKAPAKVSNHVLVVRQRKLAKKALLRDKKMKSAFLKFFFSYSVFLKNKKYIISKIGFNFKNFFLTFSTLDNTQLLFFNQSILQTYIFYYLCKFVFLRSKVFLIGNYFFEKNRELYCNFRFFQKNNSKKTTGWLNSGSLFKFVQRRPFFFSPVVRFLKRNLFLKEVKNVVFFGSSERYSSFFRFETKLAKNLFVNSYFFLKKFNFFETSRSMKKINFRGCFRCRKVVKTKFYPLKRSGVVRKRYVWVPRFFLKVREEFGIVSINSTFSNCFITITNYKGEVLRTLSSGLFNYKGKAKKQFFVVSSLVEKIFPLLNEYNLKQIGILVKGMSPRKKFLTYHLQKPGLIKVYYIIDRTTYPFNGCFAKKAKRL